MQKKHALFPLTRLHLLIVYLSLSALGCYKWGDSPKKIPPSGQVLEYGTMKPIPNALVLLYECQGEGLGNFGCSVVDSMRSSADGKYTFSSTGFQVDAYKQGYFTDYMTAVGVLSGSEDKCNIILSPHAWLRVKIRNESGAYGFYPASNQSGLPPILLEQGKDSVLGEDIKLWEGNKISNYIFTIRKELGGGFPSVEYWTSVKAIVDGKFIPVTIDVGAFIEFYLPGHDTTDLTIIY
jgi:hypothetical protein